MAEFGPPHTLEQGLYQLLCTQMACNCCFMQLLHQQLSQATCTGHHNLFNALFIPTHHQRNSHAVCKIERIIVARVSKPTILLHLTVICILLCYAKLRKKLWLYENGAEHCCCSWRNAYTGYLRPKCSMTVLAYMKSVIEVSKLAFVYMCLSTVRATDVLLN